MLALLIFGLLPLLAPPLTVSRQTERRPAMLDPSIPNLLRAPDAEVPKYGRYPSRSAPVLGQVQRRLCAGDPTAQLLWSAAAVQDEAIWAALPHCRAACEWAWDQGKDDACACRPMRLPGCGNDPRLMNPCLKQADGLVACPVIHPSKHAALIDEFAACVREGSADTVVVERLMSLEGWRSHELVAAYSIRSTPFAQSWADVSDGPTLQNRLRTRGLLAPGAARLGVRTHPALGLLALWRQYGQAARFGDCWRGGWLDGCPLVALEIYASTAVGALKDVVFVSEDRHCRTDDGPIQMEARTRRRVWRVTAPDCRSVAPARLLLLNTILEDRNAWGRLRVGGFPNRGGWHVYYAPMDPAGSALADRLLARRW